MISMLALMASGFLATTSPQTILVTEVPPDNPTSVVKTQPSEVPPHIEMPTSLSRPNMPISLDPPRDSQTPAVIEEEDLPPPEGRPHRKPKPKAAGVDSWLGIGPRATHPVPDPKAKPPEALSPVDAWLGIRSHADPNKIREAPNVPAPPPSPAQPPSVAVVIPDATPHPPNPRPVQPAAVTPASPTPVTPAPAIPATPVRSVVPPADASTAPKSQAGVSSPTLDPQPKKLVPTVSTDLDELTSQCTQPGTDAVIKKSFREDSGVEAIQVSSIAVNPVYAKSLANHANNLDTMFPCLARMGTNRGDLMFYFEIKDIAGYVLVSGESKNK